MVRQYNHEVRGGGDVEVPLVKAKREVAKTKCHPSELGLLFTSEAVRLQTRQQIQMKRVFIEVQREEGRSAVILTIWLV